MLFLRVAASSNSLSELTKHMANPLEQSDDLFALFNTYKDSANRMGLNTAYRAWNACVPNVVAGSQIE
jgi:hypothetical protein